MIRNFLKNDLGTDPEDPKYRGMAGGIRLVSALLLAASVLYYLITAGLLLPLYLPGYNSLGTDKSLFWIVNLKVSFLIFSASAFFYLVSHIAGSASKSSAKHEPVSLSYLKKNILPHEIWTVLFAESVLVSYTVSDYKNVALMGETNWYVGAWEYLALCLCVLVIGRTRIRGTVFTSVMLAASMAVFAAGILMDIAGSRLGIDGWNESKFSTIGNTNWFCGYLVCVLFISAAVYLLKTDDGKSDTRIAKIFCPICFAAGSYCLYSQGSSSAYPAVTAAVLTLLVFCGREVRKLGSLIRLLPVLCAGGLAHAAAVLLGVYERANDPVTKALDGLPFQLFLFAVSTVIMFTFDKIRKSGRTETGISAGKTALTVTVSAVMIYIAVLTFNTVSDGILGTGPVLYFGDEWASSRGMTISVGLELFKGMSIREKFFGTGPDTFYSLLCSGRFPLLAEKVTAYFGGARLTNAHCEPVTMLVNTGIWGCVCFYGMLISLFAEMFGSVLHKSPDDERTDSSRTAALAASVGLMAYIVNNLFSFQTAVNLSQLSLLAGFGAAAVRNMKDPEDK